MAIILNIETATDIGSVCISKGEKILAYREGSDTFTHAKETTLLIDACLQEANISAKDLDAIAVSMGPGSYTSLRIGTSTAKGICYALNKPLIAVDTLKSMALAAAKLEKGDLYVPMIDARRMEVYTAFYKPDMTCIEDMHPLILNESTFAVEIAAKKRIVFAGNGSNKIVNAVESEQFIFTNILCNAKNLVPLSYQSYIDANFESIAYFEPTYLKPPNITTPKKIL